MRRWSYAIHNEPLRWSTYDGQSVFHSTDVKQSLLLRIFFVYHYLVFLALLVVLVSPVQGQSSSWSLQQLQTEIAKGSTAVAAVRAAFLGYAQELVSVEGALAGELPNTTLTAETDCVRNGIQTIQTLLNAARTLTPFLAAVDAAGADLNSTAVGMTTAAQPVEALQSNIRAFKTTLTSVWGEIQRGWVGPGGGLERLEATLEASRRSLGSLEGMLAFIEALGGGEQFPLEAVMGRVFGGLENLSVSATRNIAAALTRMMSMRSLVGQTDLLSAVARDQFVAAAQDVDAGLEAELEKSVGQILSPTVMAALFSQTSSLLVSSAVLVAQRRMLGVADTVRDMYSQSATTSSLRAAAENTLAVFLDRAAKPVLEACVSNLAQAAASLAFDGGGTSGGTEERGGQETLSAAATESGIIFVVAQHFRIAFALELARRVRISSAFATAFTELRSQRFVLAKAVIAELWSSSAMTRRAARERRLIPATTPAVSAHQLMRSLSEKILVALVAANWSLLAFVVNAGFAAAIVPAMASAAAVQAAQNLSPAAILAAAADTAGCKTTEDLTDTPFTSCTRLVTIRTVLNGTLYDISSHTTIAPSASGSAAVEAALLNIPDDAPVRSVVSIIRTQATTEIATTAAQGLFGTAAAWSIRQKFLRDLGSRLADSMFSLLQSGIQSSIRIAWMAGAISSPDDAWRIAQTAALVYRRFGDADRWRGWFAAHLRKTFVDHTAFVLSSALSSSGRRTLNEENLLNNTSSPGTPGVPGQSLPFPNRLHPSIQHLLASFTNKTTTLKTAFEKATTLILQRASNAIGTAASAVRMVSKRFQRACNVTGAARAMIQKFKDEFYDRELCLHLTAADDYCVGGAQKCVAVPVVGNVCQTMPEVCLARDVLQRNLTWCKGTPQEFFSGKVEFLLSGDPLSSNLSHPTIKVVQLRGVRIVLNPMRLRVNTE